jgi:acetylornithine deacetylase/succinyl-diaminopimelate desuccinylase-like protein
MPRSPVGRPRSVRILIAALALAVVVPSLADDVTEPVDAARSWLEAHGARLLRDYAAFLEIPNSKNDPAQLRINAEWIRDALAARGAEMEVVEIEGAAPLVTGTLRAEGAKRTLGLYAHYDGQPVDPERWTHGPWSPTLYTRAMEDGGEPRPFPADGEPLVGEWRLYGRSSSDDKAAFGALLAALDALRAAGLPLRSNLVFLFEGEEENSSPHLGDYLDRYGDRLQADVWLISDGPVHQSRRPQLVFGVRGITELEITVYGANRYLHSGHYGNWSPNPAILLSRLLASMKDDEGRVTIQGFYEGTVPAGPALREAAASIPPFEDDLRSEFGLAATEADNAPYLDRMLIPSLNVRGLRSATVGETARNIVPREATASIDIRLAAGNDPVVMLDLVEAHVRRQGYLIVREEPTPEERLAHPKIAKVTRDVGYPAVRTPLDLPVMRWVRARAEEAADDPLVLMPTLGGSLPLYLFEERLRRPLVIVPMVNHDNNQHAPDENLRIANLEYGVALLAALFGSE